MLDNILHQMAQQNELILYGQADYAARVENYLEELLPELNLKKIVLPLDCDQPDKTVFDFESVHQKFADIDRSLPVVVVFSIKYKAEILCQLHSLGITKVIYYDSSVDNMLKKEFLRRYFKKIGRDFFLFHEMISEHNRMSHILKVYMAVCIADKPLQEKPTLSSFITPIQVGAALTDIRIAKVTDDEGDNISERNRHYSEMTAFYWMWKHVRADYLGLCHYRRLFVDLDSIGEKLQFIDVDVLLPLPTLCEHSVYEDYLLKHIPDVWKPMLDVMRKQSPEYYEAAKGIFNGRLFYASNMCILRYEVLDDLCKWMFPIVMEVEQRVGDLSDPYYNRYAGFCTERLITLYFLYNKNHWRIAHVEKIFLT